MRFVASCHAVGTSNCTCICLQVSSVAKFDWRSEEVHRSGRQRRRRVLVSKLPKFHYLHFVVDLMDVNKSSWCCGFIVKLQFRVKLYN